MRVASLCKVGLSLFNYGGFIGSPSPTSCPQRSTSNARNGGLGPCSTRWGSRIVHDALCAAHATRSWPGYFLILRAT